MTLLRRWQSHNTRKDIGIHGKRDKSKENKNKRKFQR